MRILICDDDAACAETCRNALTELARKHSADVSIETVNSGEALLFCIDTKYAKTDLIYLDLHLPNSDGLATAKALREKNNVADIVFYTVDGTHAIDGYDVDALHYIVKGKTDPDKFERIFLKALHRTELRSVEMISLFCAGEHRNIPIREIHYFEVQDHITTVHYGKLGQSQVFEFYSSLAKIQEFLFGKGFIRIHSSYLISEQYIAKKSSKQVEMQDGRILTVGRAYVSNLK